MYASRLWNGFDSDASQRSRATPRDVQVGEVNCPLSSRRFVGSIVFDSLEVRDVLVIHGKVRSRPPTLEYTPESEPSAI